MRKKSLFLAICLMVIVTSVQAQTISPIQLKEARMAVYQWVRDYNVYARMESKRNPIRRFTGLFEDESTVLFNDYLPMFSTHGENISVQDYASILANRDTKYKMSFKIQNAEITDEKLVGEDIVFTMEFDKIVSFQEKNVYTDTLYAYPEKVYHATIKIRYNTTDKKAIAKGIHSDKSFNEILVLHDVQSENVNQYTTHADLERKCRDNTSPLIKWNYEPVDFDEQMVYFRQDTAKNAFHVSGAIGGAFYSARLVNDNFMNPTMQGGLDYSFSVGYYRQLFLKENHRLGVDFSLQFVQRNIGFRSNGYHQSYDAIDFDGGEYLRLIDIDNYRESVQRFMIDIPVAIRYDYFFDRNMSIYSKVGVDVSYDFMQKAHATAHAQYSGYYDWLFDVIITQNGIYDFGRFDIEGNTKSVGINRLGIGAFAAVGIQYFIPNSKWSVDVGLLYGCEVFNKTTHPENFILSENNTDWKSASFLFSSFKGHNIQLQLNFNYNF